MLLTLSQPTRSDFEFKHPHDYPQARSYSPSARHSPKVTSGPSPLSQSLPASAPSTMSTSHRGLPPPAAMTLPDPSRTAPPPMSVSQSLGQMPAPPQQWQGAEESMRNWLSAKAEEDKRKQEEEKTRQETLRLEQRKIEQAMLRESMQGGVPPHLVPMIFAGIGGGSAAGVTVDWLQQYVAQLQAQQQQALAQVQVSPDMRRGEQRMINPAQPGVYAGAQQVVAAPSVVPGQAPAQPAGGPFSAPTYTAVGSMSPRGRAGSGYPQHPKPPAHSQLPRLTTNEMQIQQPPQAQSLSTIQQSQQQEPQTSSPSIYFHHWVPPTTQSSSDYASSPKKRKAQGAHQAAPAPTSAPQYTSPSFSHVSGSSTSTPGRRGHARTRSDQSSRGYGTEQTQYTGRSRAGTHTGAESSAYSERHASHDPHRREQHHQQQQQQPLQPPQGSEERGNHGSDGEGSERSSLVQRETRPSVQAPQGSRPSTPKREAGTGRP